MGSPAILGGAPLFPDSLPLVKPELPDFDGLLADDIEQMVRSGMLTKGDYVQAFERAAAAYLDVDHVVAVSSCTLGLVLTLDSLAPGSEVIVPSFTFMATVHPVVRAGLVPVFADIDARTWNLDPQMVAELITPRTSAILAVHQFGNPCRTEELDELARKHGLRLFFDAAHGMGSLRGGRPVGSSGDAEIFSLSPTKLLVAGEGGLVATRDAELAAHVRVGREYGNAGNYDSAFCGLNARMAEFNALLGLRGLAVLPDRASRRAAIAAQIQARLRRLPGLQFQEIDPRDASSYKDFAFLVDARRFGLTRDELARCLHAEGIDTRTYHDPPVHRHAAYRAVGVRGDLAVTDHVAAHIITIPIWSAMDDGVVDRLCTAIERAHAASPRIRERLQADAEPERLLA